MDTREILQKVKSGEISLEEAEKHFTKRPFTDMGYAKPDDHRCNRTGFPEVVFCEGKPDEYLVEIYKHMVTTEGCAFGTRASNRQFEFVRAEVKDAEYDPVSRILKVTGPEMKMKRRGEGFVTVCCAGTADVPVAEEAVQTAEYFGAHVERIYDVGVSGIHGLLAYVDTLQRSTCVITVAGMEGALASVVGGLVKNPVIAVPTSIGYGAAFEGLSALLTMINSCANGVAAVNIDDGYGAGYIATQINRLAVKKSFE